MGRVDRSINPNESEPRHTAHHSTPLLKHTHTLTHTNNQHITRQGSVVLYVGNLPSSAEAGMLSQLVQPYGQVLHR